MPSISDSTAAAYSNASVRNELAVNAVKDANDQDRQVADRLQEAKTETDQEDRRERRQIPGLGEAVDITA